MVRMSVVSWEKKVGLEEGLEQSEGRGGIEFMSQSKVSKYASDLTQWLESVTPR
jgi:hypothetical protein